MLTTSLQLLFIHVCLAQHCFASVSTAYTWISGANSTFTPSARVTPSGVYSPGNVPGSRREHCLTTHDSLQKLYLFGGINYGGAYVSGMLNELWVYDMATNQWAFLTGTINTAKVPPVHGTYQQEDRNNTPGSMIRMGCAVSPSDGHLYIHSGSSYWSSGDEIFASVVNELWRYNTTSRFWSWLSGNGLGNTLSEVGPDANVLWPSNREYSSMVAHAWLPVLTVFGGVGFCQGTSRSSGALNDLWEFNITSLTWARLSGLSLCGDAGSYGLLNAFDSTNIPPARRQHKLVATSDGNLYLFGGNNDAIKPLSDLWQFTYSSTRQWVWISGPRTTNQVPSYGALGEFNSKNTPGSRADFQLQQIGSLAALVLAAGFGNGVRRTDVWIYDLMLQQWGFVGGSNVSEIRGTYGNMTISSNNTYPGSRSSHAMACVMNQSICYLHGGNGRDMRNIIGDLGDLWVLNITDFSSTFPAATVTMQSNAFTTTLDVSSTVQDATDLNYGAAYTTEEPSPSIVLPGNGTASGGVASSLISVIVTFVGAFAGVLVIINVLLKLRQIRGRKRAKAAGAAMNDTERMSRASSTTALGKSYIVSSANSSATTKAASSVGFNNTTSMSISSASRTAHSGNTTYLGPTAVQDTREFSLPGFLQFQPGEDFRWDKQIAKGGGGEVYVGVGFVPQLTANSSNVIIVKMVAKSTKSLNPKALRAYYQEVTVMHYLTGHRHIAQILGWSAEPLTIIVKYYSAGSLTSYMKSGNIHSKSAQLRCLLDVAQGLKFMHAKLVAHRDIKMDNVLVDVGADGLPVYVLSDFGITAIFAPELALVRAFHALALNGLTIAYAAPEVLRRFRAKLHEVDMLQAFQGDIFSASMLIYAAMCQREPWK